MIHIIGFVIIVIAGTWVYNEVEKARLSRKRFIEDIPESDHGEDYTKLY